MSLFNKLRIRGLSLADQIVFSIGNFLLSVTLARHFTEVSFAGYGIGLSVALIVLGIQRNCYVVQNAILPSGIFRRRADKVLGQQAVFCGILITLELLMLGGVYAMDASPYIKAILFSVLVCTLIYAQLDFNRIAFIKHDRYAYPLVSSLGFLALNGALFWAIPHYGLSFTTAMTILAAYSFIMVSWLFLVLGAPNLYWGWRLLKRDFKIYVAGALAGVMGYSGYNHFPLFVLGGVATPLQSAAFTAMRGLTQPMQIIVRGLDLIDKNAFQGKGAATPAGIRATLRRQFLFYIILSISAFTFVSIFGEPLIALTYGEKYTGFTGVLAWWTAMFGLMALGLPLETAVVKMGKINTYNTTKIIAGLIATIFAVIVCPIYGAIGAVIACFVGWLIATLIGIWMIRKIIF